MASEQKPDSVPRLNLLLRVSMDKSVPLNNDQMLNKDPLFGRKAKNGIFLSLAVTLTLYSSHGGVSD